MSSLTYVDFFLLKVFVYGFSSLDVNTYVDSGSWLKIS